MVQEMRERYQPTESPQNSPGELIPVTIEATNGKRYECNVSADHKISAIAADFYEEILNQSSTSPDPLGRNQRVVVDLIDPHDPNRARRLNGKDTAGGANLRNGSYLRISTESIAGVVDQEARLRALSADHLEMIRLVEWNTRIRFEANKDHAPTVYTVTFLYPSFKALSHDGDTPIMAQEHQVEITLGAEYPRQVPCVVWKTPIFHPNIHPQDGRVCLGVLGERYLPGLGLARLVTILAEMGQWRNFDMTNALNPSAAEWAAKPEHQKYITQIDGYPFQGPVYDLLQELAGLFQEKRPRLTFTPLQDRKLP